MNLVPNLFFLVVIQIILFSSPNSAQIIDIPDQNFKNTLLAIGLDFNNNGEIEVFEAENLGGLLDLEEKGISSLNGIQYFKNVTWLDCGENAISELDLRGMESLKTLYCNENQLESLILPTSKNIKFIDFQKNKLAALNLDYFENLTSLHCGDNPNFNLDVSKNLKLERLHCYRTNLSSLDLSENTSLIHLSCFQNSISDLILPISEPLEYIDCRENVIEALDIKPYPNLKTLVCSDNLIRELDFSNASNFLRLSCGNNLLTELDCSYSEAQKTFYCANNDLVSININNGADEKNFINFQGNPNLEYICADDFQLENIEGLATEFGYTDLRISDNCLGLINPLKPLSIPSKLSIYPNPCSNSIHIVGVKRGDVSIFDHLGRLVLSKEVVGNSIDVEYLSTGYYIVQVRSNNVVYLDKFIKE